MFRIRFVFPILSGVCQYICKCLKLSRLRLKPLSIVLFLEYGSLQFVLSSFKPLQLTSQIAGISVNHVPNVFIEPKDFHLLTLFMCVILGPFNMDRRELETSA